MTSKTTIVLAFAAGCTLGFGAMPSAKAQLYPQAPAGMPVEVVTNGPQASPGDFGGWSARRNNIESAQYDRLLQSSPGFRNARMRKECGPIGDPQLREQCLASFGWHEPMMTGSSTPPRQWHQRRGAGY